jgi:hypothetical protein
MGLAGWIMMDEEAKRKQEEYEKAVEERKAANEPTDDLKKPEKALSPLQALELQQEPKEEVKKEKVKPERAE